jgi:hypothetical protein
LVDKACNTDFADENTFDKFLDKMKNENVNIMFDIGEVVKCPKKIFSPLQNKLQQKSDLSTIDVRKSERIPDNNATTTSIDSHNSGAEKPRYNPFAGGYWIKILNVIYTMFTWPIGTELTVDNSTGKT